MSDDIRLSAAKTARRCACRGWIIGWERASADNGVAVDSHQLTEDHQKWDREAWVETNTAKVDVPIATLKKIA